MRATAGRKALEKNAASSQTVTRFEVEIPTQEWSMEPLSSINGSWISKAVRAAKYKS